jgi:hypothetical protein
MANLNENYAETFIANLKRYAGMDEGKPCCDAGDLLTLESKIVAVKYSKTSLSSDDVKSLSGSDTSVSFAHYTGGATNIACHPSSGYNNGLKIMYTIHDIISAKLEEAINAGRNESAVNIIGKLGVIFNIYRNLSLTIHVCSCCRGIEGHMSVNTLLTKLLDIIVRANAMTYSLILVDREQADNLGGMNAVIDFALEVRGAINRIILGLRCNCFEIVL